MDKNKVIKNYSNYCQKCGWNITDEKIEKLRGYREKIYYCEQCGSKLLKREINDTDIENKIINKSVMFDTAVEFDKDLIIKNETDLIFNIIRNEEFNYFEIENLAEMIGIILGDGHLHKRNEYTYKSYVLSISLNRIDDLDYVNYVYSLMEKIFDEKPKIYPRKNSKGVDLMLFGKSLVNWLISLGLKSGDKVQNQISVPKWIKKSKYWKNNNIYLWNSVYRPLVKRCLKGLFDTDGSIYIARRDKKLGIIFKNGSLPLVVDFKEMCESLNISISKLNSIWETSKKTGKRTNSFYVQIQAKDQIKKFLRVIKPKKWDFKKDKISEKLNKMGLSINECLNYHTEVYNKNNAEIFKQLYEELGGFQAVEDFLEQQGENPLIANTIRKHVKRLFEEPDYIKKYGVHGYRIWLSNNSSIIIDEKKKKVKIFQLGMKKFICREIFKFLLENSYNASDSLINADLKSIIFEVGFERLSFLLNDLEKEKILIDYFENLIKFVKYIYKHPDDMQNPIIILSALKLPFNLKQIIILFEDLKEHFFNFT